MREPVLPGRARTAATDFFFVNKIMSRVRTGDIAHPAPEKEVIAEARASSGIIAVENETNSEPLEKVNVQFETPSAKRGICTGHVSDEPVSFGWRIKNAAKRVAREMNRIFITSLLVDRTRRLAASELLREPYLPLEGELLRQAKE